MPELKVKIGSDVRGFKAGVAKVKSRIRSLGSSLKKAFSFTGLAIGGGIVGTLTLLTKKSINLAAKFEQTKVAYETMMGSSSKAQVLLDKLTKFSAVTPFEPDQVYKAGKTLLSFGVDAESIIPTLRKIGDISAGTGKDFNELVAIFGKVKTKGKAQAEELNQMAEAGIPIIQTLAEMYNMTGEEIYNMASKGKISFADIERSFDKMTAEGSKFGGMMEKQSQTFDGLWSTMVGNVKEVAKAIGEDLLPELKKAVEYTNLAAKNIADMDKARKTPGLQSTYGDKGDGFWAKIARGGVNLIDNAGSLIGIDQAFDKYMDITSGGSRNVIRLDLTPEEKAQLELRKGQLDFEKVAGIESEKSPVIKRRAQEAADYEKAMLAMQQEREAQERKQAEAEERQKKAVADTVKALNEKLKIQRLIMQGQTKAAAIEQELAKAQKSAGRALTEKERAEISRLAGMIYDESRKQQFSNTLPRFNAPASVTDSMLRIGGYHGGQANISDIPKQQLQKLAKIENKVESLDMKTPYPTANNSRQVFR